MKNELYIRELASGNLSLKGYSALISLMHYMINRYRWSKIILDESSIFDKSWSVADYPSFFHQFFHYLIESKKLVYLEKIPDEYVDYYFKQILVSYVSKKIKEKQSLYNVSYDSVKRIGLEVLAESYILRTINNRKFWGTSLMSNDPEQSNETLKELVNKLPKINIKADNKQLKPLIKIGIDDIFSLINEPIEERPLISLLYSLFDSTGFLNIDEDIPDLSEINLIKIDVLSTQIFNKIEPADIPIIMDYFFGDIEVSMQDLSNKYIIPKSTIHVKLNKFRSLISKAYTPSNTEEGIEFLRNLRQKLDDA
jgi:hypothetical protein